jgi:hypothetical protein
MLTTVEQKIKEQRRRFFEEVQEQKSNVKTSIRPL